MPIEFKGRLSLVHTNPGSMREESDSGILRGGRRMWWAVACGLGYLAALLVVIWSRGFQTGYLIGATGALVGAGLALRAVRPRGHGSAPESAFRLLVAALGVLLFSVLAGFMVDHRLER